MSEAAGIPQRLYHGIPAAKQKPRDRSPVRGSSLLVARWLLLLLLAHVATLRLALLLVLLFRCVTLRLPLRVLL